MDTSLSAIQEKLDQTQTMIERVDLLNEYAAALNAHEQRLQAAEVCLQAYELACVAGENGQPYQRGLARSLVGRAAVLLDEAPYPQTLKLLLEALALLEQVEDLPCLAEALNHACWAYFCIGDFSTAQAYAERAIATAEECEDWKQLSSALNSAGGIFGEINDFDRAIQYLHRSIGIAQQNHNARDQALAYNNLAMTLLSQNKYREAEEAGLTALSLIHPLNLPFAESAVLDTVGLAYEGMEQLEQAAVFFEKAIERVRSLEKAAFEMEPRLHLGQVWLKKGDLQKAEQNLLLAYDSAHKNETARIEYLCHEKLADLYEKRGQFKEALTHFRCFHQHKNSMFSLDNMQQVANLTAVHKLETAMKDAEILQLRNAVLVQEIEREKRRHAELEHFATTDSLTGLFNRRHFLTLASFEFAKANAEKNDLGMIMVDVDHFKKVNDRHGHPIGDQVLVQIAAALNSHIRQQDLCCRYGGEEFLALLPYSNLEDSLVIANRLRLQIESLRVNVGDDVIRVTVSAGIACLKPDDLTLDQLIYRVDQALLLAKANGRNITVSLP